MPSGRRRAGSGGKVYAHGSQGRHGQAGDRGRSPAAYYCLFAQQSAVVGRCRWLCGTHGAVHHCHPSALPTSAGMWCAAHTQRRPLPPCIDNYAPTIMHRQICTDNYAPTITDMYITLSHMTTALLYLDWLSRGSHLCGCQCLLCRSYRLEHRLSVRQARHFRVCCMGWVKLWGHLWPCHVWRALCLCRRWV